jgi:predicted transcriptional regulator
MFSIKFNKKKKAGKGKELKTYKPSPLLNKILTKKSDALKKNFVNH